MYRWDHHYGRVPESISRSRWVKFDSPKLVHTNHEVLLLVRLELVVSSPSGQPSGPTTRLPSGPHATMSHYYNQEESRLGLRTPLAFSFSLYSLCAQCAHFYVLTLCSLCAQCAHFYVLTMCSMCSLLCAHYVLTLYSLCAQCAHFHVLTMCSLLGSHLGSHLRSH